MEDLTGIIALNHQVLFENNSLSLRKNKLLFTSLVLSVLGKTSKTWANFITQVQDCNVSTHNILMIGMWSYLRASRKCRHFFHDLERWPLRPPFLNISAHLSLSPGSESRHFEILSCFPLSLVQTPLLFSKPICHALVFQVLRFWISWLINCHSSSVSMETK